MESEYLYEKYKEGNHWEKHPTVYAENFAEFLKKKGINGKIVDVGCGNGRDVNVFYTRGFDVIGIDYASKEIDKARENFPSCSFEIQNAEELTFEDESVSAIFCINMIHYVNMRKTLDEFMRILRSGGYVYIHFNLKIVNVKGEVDYKHDEKDVLELVSGFQVIKKRIFERVDKMPFEHTHKILELILRKD